MYWSGRARAEFEKWPATYMVTLTMRPEMHYHFDAIMYDRFPQLAKEIKALPEGLAAATLFTRRTQVVGPEVTKYLKRVRLRAPFRYLQVAERHREPEPGEVSAVAGRPHFHILLHELELGALVKPEEYRLERGYCTRCARFHTKEGELCDHAYLRQQWTYGFTKIRRCVDSRSATYLCKYISKAMSSRVRASIDYGGEGLVEAGPHLARSGTE